MYRYRGNLDSSKDIMFAVSYSQLIGEILICHLLKSIPWEYLKVITINCNHARFRIQDQKIWLAEGLSFHKRLWTQRRGKEVIIEARSTSGQKDTRIKSLLQTKDKTFKAKRLPVKVDNRNYCSPVKDQGQLGSCTANMAAKYVRIHEQTGEKQLRGIVAALHL